MANDKLLVRGLGKEWAAHKVLTDIHFEQPPGTIYGITGDNGAGKSTLLKILATVLKQDEGQAWFQGISIGDLGAWRPITGYVPQDLALDGRLRVRETLNFWAAARGFSRDVRKEVLKVAASDPLISDFLEKTVRDCSGGMARRVSLVVGLLGDPALLLLDEPFAGADQASRKLMMERLDILRSRGRTILISSHEADLLGKLSDRILQLEEGRLLPPS